jgi:hypothetical protein
MDRREQVSQPADPARLVGDELAAGADQRPQLDVELARCFDRSHRSSIALAQWNSFATSIPTARPASASRPD